MNNTSSGYFPDVIGQEDVKSKLSFYIDGYKKTSQIPHFLFIAEKGCGKTMIAGKVAKHLTVDGKPKKAKELNCSTIKSFAQFVEQIGIPLIQDNDCTLVFDEASELTQDMTMSLLTMLNPNDSNRTSIATPDGGVLEVNFKRHSFMFCTTEPQKVFHALMSRLTRVDFQPYKLPELMTIVKKNVDKNDGKIKFTEDVEKDLPTVLRTNPRCAQMMANDVISYCAQFGVKLFDKLHWGKMKKALGIKPLGLNATELRVLQILEKSPHCRLTDIGAKIGMTSSAIQRDIELFLLRNNLVTVKNGRCLTEEGKQYLKDLAKV
jgi:Holliday junction resolvasome RuvABC ATP-dependent DNA helicase subunit